MPKTEKGEKIYRAMQEQYGPEKGKEVFYASRNKGTITGVDEASTGLGNQQAIDQGPLPSNLPTTAIQPNAGPTTMPMNSVPQANSPVTGDISYPPEGPKGIVRPIGELPEEREVHLYTNAPPSGIPDQAGGRAEKTFGPMANELKEAALTRAANSAELRRAELEREARKEKDATGHRLAAMRPADKAIGTVRDYARAAGAKDNEATGALKELTNKISPVKLG